MRTREETEARFTKDVAEHKMTIIRSDGLYRHLRFQKPGTSAMQFDIITWPGHLCYTGDMGTYVFSRLSDMFEFFRSDSDRINPSYWAEKLQAVDCAGGRGAVDEYSPDLFREVVKRRLDEWIDDQEDLSKGDVEDLRAEVECEVTYAADDGEYRAFHAAHDFYWSENGHIFQFTDFFETKLTEYTFHYLWCCYALVWGIQQFDEALK